MQLKLAEYNLETVNFEKFLELGKHFGYFGNYIRVISEWEMGQPEEGSYTDCPTQAYLLDEKDPLNRFSGLFNDRSYGNGRFILIQDKQDIVDIVETKRNKIKGYCLEGMQRFKYEEPFISIYDEFGVEYLDSKNLHENPELWEKIK